MIPWATFTHWHVEAALCNQSVLLSTTHRQSHARHLFKDIISCWRRGQHYLIFQPGQGFQQATFGTPSWHAQPEFIFKLLLCNMSQWTIMDQFFWQLLFHFSIIKTYIHHLQFLKKEHAIWSSAILTCIFPVLKPSALFPLFIPTQSISSYTAFKVGFRYKSCFIISLM